MTDRTELERNLFRKLLDLGHIEDVETALREALKLAVEITGAEQGYIEVHGEESPTAIQEVAEGMDDEQVELARSRVSRGIIAEALEEGLLHTPSALLDERFSERQSVRQRGIESVVCAPIGTSPSLGAIYLSGPNRFAEPDLELLRVVVRDLAPVVAKLMATDAKSHDATAEWRSKVSVPSLVGRSPALAGVLRQISMIGPLDVPVLLKGASGTGKTLVAKAIHDNSPRANQPFVHLNCANIPATLVESELFGVERGAFSHADQPRAGKVEAAEGGTLFLDEIAELPESSQASLLTLLQQKAYYRLGSTVERKANVRIVTATNAELEERIRERKFREDLFFRINVFPIRMPTLAERVEDIASIAQHLVSVFCQEQGMPEIRLAPTAPFYLKNRDWPGNVRELENVIQRAVIRANAEGASAVEAHHVQDPTPSAGHEALSFRQATRDFQREFVASALEKTGWNVARAAEDLRIARAHLYNLIREHGLKRPDKSS